MRLIAQPLCKAHKFLFVFILSAISSTAFGAGFQISEQSGTGLGRAFAGFGVIGDDLSMAFYNPAGLTMQEGTQIQFSGFLIEGESKFSNNGSTRIPAIVPAGGNDDGAETAFVPNLYFTMDLTDRLKYGFAITAPYGLKTKYDRDWIGRYHAIESELVTININPSLAYKISDSFSVGAGVSADYAEATLSQAVFTGGPDGFAEVKGDDWGYGWNVGFMYHPDPTFRAAVGFRSKIKHKLSGDNDITGTPLGGGNFSASAEASVTLPETIHAGIYKEFASKWGTSFGFRWTKWDRFDELRVKTVGLPDSVAPQEWDNVISINIGVDYFYSDKWTFRAGYMYDESPTSDQFRTPRIPDEDRQWLAIGASFKPITNLSIDMGYTHIFIDDANVDRTIPIAGGAGSDRLAGEYKDPEVDILSIQAVYKF